MRPPDLVVAGTPSIDRLEVGGTVHRAVGGSGFITALAARVSGVSAGIVARVPAELPPEVAEAFRPGRLDPGGLVPVDGVGLPGFHIRHDGDRATYLGVARGAEAELDAEDLPRRWLGSSWIHVGPLAGTAAVQLRFVEGLRRRGYRGGLSAGTFVGEIEDDPEAVRRLFDLVDVAFLNREEANLLYGGRLPTGTALLVTEGSGGVLRWDGITSVHHAVDPVEPVDPTGAGDAFAGGYLAGMLLGTPDPVAEGLRTARIVLGAPGASALVEALPERLEIVPDPVAAAPVAAVDDAAVARIAERLAEVADAAALDFCGDPLPAAGEDHALEILALATLHQYGFWYADEQGWTGPMWATIGGRRRKGSDFLWAAFTRAARQDPSVLDPDRLAGDPLLFDRICTADDGTRPVPDSGSHRALQTAYGAAMARHGGFAAVLEQANRAPNPVARLLELLARVPGYGEDPLAKKANLLALVLGARPEGFLRPFDPSGVGPIVDYHVMRGCLRTGCVRVVDPDLRRRLVERRLVDATEEAAVRLATKEAVELLCERSGLSVAAVDGFLFRNGRTVCLEEEDPTCERCPVAAACSRDADLFQPVLRTTAY